MTKRMLIDASHPEEIRVVVVEGNRLEELEVESAARKQLKGNIYLAKVTRVEPSLQAAFVDYGGNRHGFLAFSEIHPDYYQIPVADREELLAEDEESEDSGDAKADAAEGQATQKNGGNKTVETIGGDELDEVETAARPVKSLRRYKIQEVIKRRQIILVQVVKEERGNKGAALTTYLSLAGRYCVLMPNAARGGGISRKISDAGDRKRLKSIISGLDIPKGIALIVRTAGAERGKAEVERDYEYLLKLWNEVREKTLVSTAPTLVHEEANLIMRTIRDQYSRDIEEILVEGDEGYRTAKDLMKVLIPSHAKKVQPYRDGGVPLLHHYNVESQLASLNNPEVKLKSGGYIVINPTEALVSIDVNSGRATGERNIEQTALKTNLEAADEIARHLKLRDLSGLIVIDFIDMDHSRNQTTVERRLKDAMRSDRARIQIGRISHFGLLELSRQRLRPSINETIADPCEHCGGTGIRRSTESTAMHVLRGIEDETMRRRGGEMKVHMPTDVALYILNNKRDTLAEIEKRAELTITLAGDDALIHPSFRIDKADGGRRARNEPGAEADAETNATEDETKSKKRRRSRRRKRSDAAPAESLPDQIDGDAQDAEGGEPAAAETSDDNVQKSEEAEDQSAAETGEEKKTGRRRGRRGGRRRGRKAAASETPQSQAEDDAQDEQAPAEAAEAEATESAAREAAEDDVKAAAPRRRRRRKAKSSADPAEATAKKEKEKPEKPATPKRRARRKTSPADDAASSDAPPDAPPAAAESADVVVVGSANGDENKTSRKGWWRRPSV